MAAIFMAAAFTAAVSVAEALVTGASEATDFGLVGFSELLSRLLWQLLPWPLRIRPVLSDRVRDDVLLLTTAQAPRANLRIAMLH
jgi:hypothetical protein